MQQSRWSVPQEGAFHPSAFDFQIMKNDDAALQHIFSI
jgi:hypothetical protein